MKKRIAILGSTGSVGENAVRVALAMKDDVEVTVLAANTNAERIAEQAQALGAKHIVLSDAAKAHDLKRLAPPGCTAAAGCRALEECVCRNDVDIVLLAIVGTAGLYPALAAVKSHKTIALASKEVMVMAGSLVTELADAEHVQIIPVDSEHSALFQCLEGRAPETVKELLLTASGGPFRKSSKQEISKMTVEQALKHPTWSMGPKVTIDSASLMNKALEIIEARWLFRMPPEKIQVIIHPQSIIHSMVRFADGAVLAHMSVPDMRFPIQYAFTYPSRRQTNLEPLDFTKIQALTFENPDTERFPALNYAYEALRTGKTMPAVLNAANEIAVKRFCAAEISFPDIWKIVSETMNAHQCGDEKNLESIVEADLWARSYAMKIK